MVQDRDVYVDGTNVIKITDIDPSSRYFKIEPKAVPLLAIGRAAFPITVNCYDVNGSLSEQHVINGPYWKATNNAFSSLIILGGELNSSWTVHVSNVEQPDSGSRMVYYHDYFVFGYRGFGGNVDNVYLFLRNFAPDASKLRITMRYGDGDDLAAKIGIVAVDPTIPRINYNFDTSGIAPTPRYGYAAGLPTDYGNSSAIYPSLGAIDHAEHVYFYAGAASGKKADVTSLVSFGAIFELGDVGDTGFKTVLDTDGNNVHIHSLPWLVTKNLALVISPDVSNPFINTVVHVHLEAWT